MPEELRKILLAERLGVASGSGVLVCVSVKAFRISGGKDGDGNSTSSYTNLDLIYLIDQIMQQ
jgi:hypothetical protein